MLFLSHSLSFSKTSLFCLNCSFFVYCSHGYPWRCIRIGRVRVETAGQRQTGRVARFYPLASAATAAAASSSLASDSCSDLQTLAASVCFTHAPARSTCNTRDLCSPSARPCSLLSPSRRGGSPSVGSRLRACRALTIVPSTFARRGTDGSRGQSWKTGQRACEVGVSGRRTYDGPRGPLPNTSLAIEGIVDGAMGGGCE